MIFRKNKKKAHVFIENRKKKKVKVDKSRYSIYSHLSV